MLAHALAVQAGSYNGRGQASGYMNFTCALQWAPRRLPHVGNPYRRGRMWTGATACSGSQRNSLSSSGNGELAGCSNRNI
eukprot:6209320-Pleurochrysis_carterae.AAC.1